MTEISDDSLLNRIHDTNGVPVNDLECSICHDLFWKPVQCAHCENLYCIGCIKTWLQTQPQTCPHCKSYAEKKCHPIIVKQLSRLQIKCVHWNNGCREIITYEALEQHENNCSYRDGQCSGCQMTILVKDLLAHEKNCLSIKWTCPNCYFVCARDAAPSHTDKICFQNQLMQRDSIMSKLQIDMMKTLDQIMNRLQEQDRAIQRVNQRVSELSLRIPNSLPLDLARWHLNAATVAGGNDSGDKADQLRGPCGLFVDEHLKLYIADYGNHRIMRWKAGATTGEVLAGGNGSGNRLNQLNGPMDMIVDQDNDSLVICDRANRRVMRWPLHPSSQRQPEIVIDNIDCRGLATDNYGSLYISDTEKHEVRRYDKNDDKKGTVVAGGHGKGANLNQLNWPTHIFVDAQSTLYVSDKCNYRVIKWMKGAKEGIVVAGGNGCGGNMKQLYDPKGVWVNGNGHVYVVDEWNHRVMRWQKGAKVGTVIVGGHGRGAQANQLSRPSGLFFDRHGHLYVTDNENNRIQRFSLC